MGASWCGPSIDRRPSSTWDQPTSPERPGHGQALVLQVVRAPIEESLGARLSGYQLNQELLIKQLDTLSGFEPLTLRYKSHTRSKWPQSYRFQASKRSWRATVLSGDGWRQREEACVLQLAAAAEQRSLENVELDLEDAKNAASYAHRFNLYLQQSCGSEAAPALTEGESLPSVKVAAPVGCQVISSSYPAMIPVGSACTLAPYSASEVRKFVFDGSEDFLELPHAYFHYAAFSSSGKQLVCDIQGCDEDDGAVLFLDPCVLRMDLPTVSGLMGAVVPGAGPGHAVASEGPTPERFDALHPRCAQLCKAFDPQRKSLKNHAGACGMGGTCGFGRG